jgi:hypothetical protein
MANIPVERDTSRPWWIWLLGLLLLALLIWLLVELLSDDDDAELATVDPVEEVTPVAPAPVADAEMDLSNLYVTRVTGDRTFYVSPSADNTTEEMLVVLDQNMSPDVGGIEGQVDINAGQMVDLSDGERMMLSSYDYASRDFAENDLTELNALDPTTEFVLIDGGDVDIYEADLENVEVGE